MKESRLFQIVYCLLNQGHVTANQLATDLEVSIRTIYRDLDSLSAAGIPIYTESGRNGGIYLMKDYTLDKTLLSDTEKAEILTSLQGMNAALGFHNETVLNKLRMTDVNLLSPIQALNLLAELKQDLNA